MNPDRLLYDFFFHKDITIQIYAIFNENLSIRKLINGIVYVRLFSILRIVFNTTYWVFELE